MTIDYVCGYGRSGSTTLGRLLAHQLNGIALGEIASAVVPKGTSARELQCSCGSALAKCTFWGPVLCKAPRNVGRDAILVATILDSPLALALPRQLLSVLASRACFSQILPMTSLPSGVQVLSQESPGRLIVDTSKTSYRTAGRPLALAVAGAKIRLHLPTRPWREVRSSYIAAHHRRNRPVSASVATCKVLTGMAFSRATTYVVALRLRQPVTRYGITEIVRRAGDGESDHDSHHMVTGNRARVLPLRGGTTDGTANG